MKDYYQILGVPENSDSEEIKKAFRRLAFQHHPDKNPGNEKQAEEKFKEINEAYGVLGDEERRRQYDYACKGAFAGANPYGGYNGFGYSQQDIFTNIFSNRATFDELNRMFAQAGLRFDQDFLNQVFFSGRGIVFQFFTTPMGKTYRYGYTAAPQSSATIPALKPGLVERWLSKLFVKFVQLVLGAIFGVRYESTSKIDLDEHAELELSPEEAASGSEIELAYQHNGVSKKLLVKVPAGVSTGTRIRLQGMGKVKDGKRGDLYLHVRIKN